jgi:hypothetical protein
MMKRAMISQLVLGWRATAGAPAGAGAEHIAGARPTRDCSPGQVLHMAINGKEFVNLQLYY